MAFKDEFDKEISFKKLEKYMPDGYDIYVMGIQEGTNLNIFLAM